MKVCNQLTLSPTSTNFLQILYNIVIISTISCSIYNTHITNMKSSALKMLITDYRSNNSTTQTELLLVSLNHNRPWEIKGGYCFTFESQLFLPNCVSCNFFFKFFLFTGSYM